MSVDHLKKQAKTAKQLLLKLFERHPPPYSLAESQEFVAHIQGYPSWHIALKAQGRKSALSDDPIAAFYGYDWRQASLNGCTGLDDPTTCRVVETPMSPADAQAYLRNKGSAPLPMDDAIVVINSAGKVGRDSIDEMVARDALAKGFGMMSFVTISHRTGATINPVGGFSSAQVASLFCSLLDSVASPQQVVCCREALDLVLPQERTNLLDLRTIQQAVDRLIRLAQGGWSKDDEDFYETFPVEDRHGEAHALVGRYGEKIPSLVRPLDALLTRLTVPGLDKAFDPGLCEAEGEGRDEAFDVGPEGFSMGCHGLQFIDLNFGSDVLNHLAALLVLAKIRFASRFHQGFGLTEALPTIEVLWMRP